ncbi:hypothetical protein BWQ96_10618 [Gracilariopsis chorda]|uniref:Uncharacterized protein n=1 Tax=Gracilariopsis chorda TaxID=448386 RepID=A0A2V3IC61_9FLOR|nr:hypothetical protein BWQ96_10618 [Gracilariopsis chorda]|eukprot:PXF39684.1 hypothetical protein BWQ96_10618 [Gracilariopsis chorda]
MAASVFNSVLLASLFLQVCWSLEFPTYSYRDHPFYTSPEHDEARPSPVVMHKYYTHNPKAGKVTGNLLFAPRSATYNSFPSKQPFGSKLDALFIPGTSNESKSTFVEVHVNRRTRVLLVLNGKGLSLNAMKNLASITVSVQNGETLEGFVPPLEVAFQSVTKARLGRIFSLPRHGAIVERIVEPDEPLLLPHPGSVSVNNVKCRRFTLLFAKPEEGNPIAFESPHVPEHVHSHIRGEIVKTTPVFPNMKCPNWLHDMHVTSSRDSSVARTHGEQVHWRTWHPPIDPVFWCYYDHEHGSFPGKHWPMFGYTAWKTFDNTTVHKRQDESHNGFKTYSFPVPGRSRYVVIVVHMHLSFARRFTARHHTVSFTVLDKNWNVEMELHMKMDFGAAVVTLKDGGDEPISDRDVDIQEELGSRGVLANRRFNILNEDENYPESVDPRFRLNCGRTATEANKRAVLRGIYEQWRGPLNTCSKSNGRINRGFNFDVRNPSTALRFLNDTSDENTQKLSGNGVNRFLKVRNGLEFGVDHCHFGNSSTNFMTSDGVFYTDPYFSVVEEGPGTNSVRQYIKPGFKPLNLDAGVMLPIDAWYSHMTYVPRKTKPGGRRFMNMERSVFAAVN